jgi:ComEC/Rec2-related protein
LLNGIVFGIKTQLAPELKNALIRTGTLHIVALSGMNITIIANLVASTLLRVFSRRVTSLLTILIIMGFVQFVGMSPSVIRAALMGILALLSTVFGRQKGALWLLIFAGILMLLYNLSYLTDLSFQLSFGATLGIIIFRSNHTTGPCLTASPELPLRLDRIEVSREASRQAGRLPLLSRPTSASAVNDVQSAGTRRESRPALHPWFVPSVPFIWNLVKDDLKTTLSAQVFTTPLLMFTFHRISILSPVANVLIGWIIQPITVVGFLVCFVGFIWFPLAIPVAWIAWLLLQYVLLVVTAVSAIPFASFEW